MNQQTPSDSQVSNIPPESKPNKSDRRLISLLTLLVISLVGAGLLFVISSVSKDENKKVENSIIEQSQISDYIFNVEKVTEESVGKYSDYYVAIYKNGEDKDNFLGRIKVAEKKSGVSNFTVSPNGKYVAFTASTAGGTCVFNEELLAIDLETLSITKFENTPEGNGSLNFIKRLKWVSDNEVEVYEQLDDWGCDSVKDLVFRTYKLKLKGVDIRDYSNWKTYRNEEYGFEFKYPTKLGDPVKSPTTKFDCATVKYWKADIGSLKSFRIGLACEQTVVTPFDNPISIAVDGKVGYFYEYTLLEGYTNKDAYIPLKNGVYVSLNHTFKPGHPDYVELSSDDFRKILSTFKFIEAQTISTKKQDGGVLYVAQVIRDDDCYRSDLDAGCGKRIIKIDESGESHVVIDDTYNLNIGDVDFLGFKDEIKKILFIQHTQSSAGSKIHLYDLNTGTYKTVAQVDYISGQKLSPDGSKLLSMRGERSLDVLDLWTGIKSTLVTLNEGETLVESIGGYGGDRLGNYEWRGNFGVSYYVYSPNDDLNVNNKRVPVDYRHVSISIIE